MNTDIRISISFLTHRKRKKLKRLLGAEGVLALIDLWLQTALNNPDGILRNMDEEDIALEAGWEGDPQEFIKALITCGFLEQLEDGTYKIHDWEEHQPWVIGAKERSERARKAALARWEKARLQEEDKNDAQAQLTDATSMQDACDQQCPSPLLSSPYLSSPSKDIKCVSSTPNGVSDTHSSPPAKAAGDLTISEPPENQPAENQTASKPPDETNEPKVISLKPETTGSSNGTGKKKLPPCPYQRIVALYHEILPELPQINEIGEALKKQLKTRWRSKKEYQSLEWWKKYFENVRKQPFLLGKNNKGWQADLYWLTRPTNFEKVLNNTYARAGPLGRVNPKAQTTYANAFKVLKEIEQEE